MEAANYQWSKVSRLQKQRGLPPDEGDTILQALFALFFKQVNSNMLGASTAGCISACLP